MFLLVTSIWDHAGFFIDKINPKNKRKLKANLELIEKNLMVTLLRVSFSYCLKKSKCINGSTSTELFNECACLMERAYAEWERGKKVF